MTYGDGFLSVTCGYTTVVIHPDKVEGLIEALRAGVAQAATTPPNRLVTGVFVPAQGGEHLDGEIPLAKKRKGRTRLTVAGVP